METRESTYRYAALDESVPVTRLLCLNRDVELDDDICGHLQSFNLDAKECPSFTTLSYVWGHLSTHADTHTINLDGHRFPVLENLWLILNALCDDHVFSRDRWVWIDFICINQEDLLERASQVQLMERIYAQSVRTIAWLGEGSPEIDMGIDFLAELSQSHSKVMGYSQIHGTREVPPELRLPEKWKALGKFLDLPWWRRMWTLQEFVIPREVVLYCGSSFIGMATVEAALSSTWFCEPDSSLLRPGLWALAWSRHRLRQWKHDRGYCDHMGLLALLAYTGSSELTDPRDRIYGLIGLANNTDRLMVGRPAYIDSVEDIYKRLVKSFIETHQTLDIICFAQTFRQPGSIPDASGPPSSSSSLPSWVPDWRVHAEPFVTPFMVSQTASRHIGNFRPIACHGWDNEPLDEEYSADGGAIPKITIDWMTGELTCPGYYVGEIDGIGTTLNSADHLTINHAPPITQSTSNYNTPRKPEPSQGRKRKRKGGSSMRQSRELLLDVVQCLTLAREDRYLTFQSSSDHMMKEFLNLITLSQTADPGDLPARCRSALAWYNVNKSLLLRGKTLEQICLDSMNPEKPCARPAAVASEQSFASRLIDCTSPLAMHKRLMTTADGSLGMAPPAARKGDVVCILLGCRVPIVLRRKVDAPGDERYWFIGECYVHEIMNGEFLDQGEEQRSFTLV